MSMVKRINEWIDYEHLLIILQQIHLQEDAEHVQQVINNNNALRNTPKGCHSYQKLQVRHFWGPMDVECVKCHAVHFKCDKLANSSNASPKFGVCCLQGQINLSILSQPPHVLHHLLTSSAPCTQKFKGIWPLPSHLSLSRSMITFLKVAVFTLSR